MAEASEAMVNSDQVTKSGLHDFYEPVPDFTAPTQNQIDNIVKFIKRMLKENKPVAVSCGAGYGRTGTILSCYLITLGLRPQEAIDSVKQVGRIPYECESQYKSILEFAKRLSSS